MKRVEFRENVRSFVPQGQSKLAVIMRCLYKVVVRKAGFVCALCSCKCKLPLLCREWAIPKHPLDNVKNKVK